MLGSRKEKQPIQMPSAGSTFKRGNNFITAKLIDECGLKGYKIGDAEVSKKHAGFIVNTGNATAQDVLDLIEYVKNTVYNKTNNLIELEEKWSKRRVSLDNWINNWENIQPFYKYGPETRKIMYTTNAIESLNNCYKKYPSLCLI